MGELCPAGGPPRVAGESKDRSETDVSRFSGGSVPKPPKQEKQEPLPPMPEVPKAPPPPAPIPPAPTTSKLEVQQAEEDQRRQAAKRKGMRQTLIAGETGGYLSPASEGKKSLLG